MYFSKVGFNGLEVRDFIRAINVPIHNLPSTDIMGNVVAYGSPVRVFVDEGPVKTYLCKYQELQRN